MTVCGSFPGKKLEALHCCGEIIANQWKEKPMKTRTTLCAAVASLCLSSVALSQTTLDKAKTDSILKELTSQARKTWISAGVIRATHYERRDPKITDSGTIDKKIAEAVGECETNLAKSDKTAEVREMTLKAVPFNVKYRLANTYTMTSTETVEYDGERFRWEIAIDSRTDSIKPDSSLAGNLMTDEFQTDVNRRRVFTWDGQKYTTSFDDGAQAVVDVEGRLPRGVYGPLTVGLIPWGTGEFSYDSLSDAKIEASNSFDGDVKTVHLSIVHADGSTTEVNLDPAKKYAVTSATMATTSGFEVAYTLSGYTSHNGQWVPSSVVIERRNVGDENAAPTIERWSDITVASTAAPSLNSFTVALAPNAVVEYLIPTSASSTLYVHSGQVDVDALLIERMTYGAAEGRQRQNCATAALQHVASQFGKSIPADALTNLVETNGSTSLYDLKCRAQELGLYGHVVKTDLAGLRSMGTAKAILHIPGKGHFVVVDHVDDQYVWLVDLSNKKFYYPQSVASFPLTWTEGTALLLSDRPITGEFAGIPDAASKDIAGGVYQACNTPLQDEYTEPCMVLSDLCQGCYSCYFERWGCGTASSGTCPTQKLVFEMYTPCIPDPIYTCSIYSNWATKIRDACE